MVKKLPFFCVAVLTAVLFLPANSVKAEINSTEHPHPHIQLVASLINSKENADGSFTIPFSAQLSNEIRDKADSSQNPEEKFASVMIHDIDRDYDQEIVSGITIKEGVIIFKADLLPKTHYEFEITAIDNKFFAEYKTPLTAEIKDEINGVETNEGEFFEELSDFFEMHWHQILIYIAFIVILLGIGGIVAIRKDQIEEKRANF